MSDNPEDPPEEVPRPRFGLGDLNALGRWVLATGDSAHARPSPDPGPAPARPPPTLPRRGLHAGAARVDLTPAFGTPAAGYGPVGGLSQHATGRMFAHALVLAAQGTPLAIVTVDLHAGTRGVERRVLARLPWLAPEQLLLVGTHTHSGPGNMYESGLCDLVLSGHRGFDAEQAEWLAERVAAAVQRAAGSLEPARIAWGSADVTGLVHNRSLGAWVQNHMGVSRAELIARAVDEYGKASPDQHLARIAVDRTVRCLVAISRADTAPIGVYATLPVHNLVLPAVAKALGSDVLGAAARHARRQLGWSTAQTIALGAGAIGDADPSLGRDALQRRSRGAIEAAALTQELGAAWGSAVVKATEAALASKARLGGKTVFSLALSRPEARGAFLPGGIALAWTPRIGLGALVGSELGRGPLAPGASLLARDPEPVGRRGRRPRHPHHPKRVPAWSVGIQRVLFGGFPTRIPLRLATLTEGTRRVQLAGVPGEPTGWVARRIAQAVGPADLTLVSGVTGGYFGYWTSPAEYDYQAYEGAFTLWGRQAGLWMVRQFAALHAGAPGPAPPGTYTAARPGPVRRLRPRRLHQPTDTLTLTGGASELSMSWRASVPIHDGQLGLGPWLELQVRGPRGWTAARWGGLPVNDVETAPVLRGERDGGAIRWSLRWSLARGVLSPGDTVRVALVGPSQLTPAGSPAWSSELPIR